MAKEALKHAADCFRPDYGDDASSETPVLTRATRRHVPEDGYL
jgi:hypothetical protein